MLRTRTGETGTARAIAVISLAVAAALLFAACGGEEPARDGTTPTEPVLPSVSSPTGERPTAPETYAFGRGDADLTFHLDTFSFRLDYTIDCAGGQSSDVEWLKVARQGSGLEVCQIVVATAGGSHVCNTGPGDFELVRPPEPDDQHCTQTWDWRVTITPQ